MSRWAAATVILFRSILTRTFCQLGKVKRGTQVEVFGRDTFGLIASEKDGALIGGGEWHPG